MAAVSRRIEIELTSKKTDDEWTWRAAGAKQPKGVLPSSLLWTGAKVGDISRAEAEFEIEGITIVSVAPPQGAKAEPENRLTITGPERKFEPVTSQLTGRSERGPSRDRDSRGGRDGRPGGRPGGSDRGGARPGGDRGAARPGGDRGVRPGADRGARPSGRPGERDAQRNDRPTGQGGRPGAASGARGRPDRPERPSTPTPTFKRLDPKDTHRRQVLDKVPVEQRPIAEHILRGGIPAVRHAVEEENTKAKAEGRPEMNGPALIAIAEQLLPELKTAEWMDRAEAAKALVNEVGVRDLRAIVTSADAQARSEEARMLAAELREALERRTNEAREEWLAEITAALDADRVVRALRLSSRLPDPQTKIPAELLERLQASAAAAMSPDTTPDRWMALLEAVSASPVRRAIEPVGLPAEPGDALLTAARQAAARIPALGRQLGVTMPPPPPRRLPPKPKPSSGAASPSAPIPPPPAQPTTPVPAAPASGSVQPTTPVVPAEPPPAAETRAGEGAPTETAAPSEAADSPPPEADSEAAKPSPAD